MAVVRFKDKGENSFWNLDSALLKYVCFKVANIERWPQMDQL